MTRYIKPLLKGLIFIAIAAVICVSFASFTANLSVMQAEEGLKITRDAVKRTAINCYAVEGVYPQSVEYMEENYGLAIDYDRYIVHYEVFASNIMPSITVIRIIH
jgi:hypothetical protein